MKFYLIAARRLALAGCAAVLTLAGCAATGPRIDSTQLTGVRKGETTVAQIVSRFGRPSILSKNMDGTQTAAYLHAESQSNAAAAIPFVGALAGADANVDSTIFYFDEKGVLSNYRLTRADVEQPAPSVASPSPQTGAGSAAQTSAGAAAQASADPSTPAAKKAPAAAASGTSSGWSLRNLQPSGVRENR